MDQLNQDSEEKSMDKNFPLVGVGASAGGLEAFKTLVSRLPNELQVSYVLVQHLDPKHKSILVDILSRHTPIPVIQISDKQVIEQGNIYVLPAGHRLSIAKGTFELSKFKSSDEANQQIDNFFRALAEEFQERSIGVILSGTMNDGSCGIKQIKEFGGLVIAQKPETAEFPEMPQSAVKTGLVDLLLEVEQIPDAVKNYVSHSYVSGNLALKNLDELEQILAIVKASAHYDFRCYKKNTLIRRILRRMGLKNIDSMKNYVKVLKDQPAEVNNLYKDLLIGVTSFFRDEEVWKRLKEDIFRKLIKALPVNSPIRVWIPGCSTGEEAYSIAILFFELFEEYGRPANLQIFATDIDETAIATARAGIYPQAIADSVSAERLRNFFSIEENGFRISRPIRESVIFAAQNLISDAPFSDLDFISCRNLLIYLDPDIQKNIIDLFSFSLREGGYLMLGCSETVGYKNDLFETVSKKLRIYRMSGNKRSERRKESIFANSFLANRRSVGNPRENKALHLQQNLEAVMHGQLLRKFAPAAVIVNQRGQIVYFFGPTEKYLNLPKNEPNFDLISMAREGLKTRLRSATHKAQKEQLPVSLPGINVSRDDYVYSITVEISPIHDNNLPKGMLLVSFSDDSSVKFNKNCSAGLPQNDEPLVKQLEQELSETREDLQNTIEELETSNEELKASNEEMMSMNEELQSTNEELETSKEELQSLNEELNSVNSQLRDKVSELEIANNDIINFMNCTEVATLFLDRNSVIRKFTPAAKSLFNLIPSDIGRPIADLNNRLKDQELSKPIKKVLKTLVAESHEIESADGKHFIRRINPFRTEDDRIDGVVITFVDITSIKESQLALAESEKRYRESNQLLSAVLHHTHMLSAYLDPEFNYIWVNQAYASNFKHEEGFFPGKNLFGLSPNAENKAIFLEVVSSGKPYYVQGKPFVFADQPERGLTYWDWSLIPVKDDDDRVTSLVLTLVEATSRIKAELSFREETKRKNKILESIKDGFFSLDNNLRINYFNQAAESLLGVKSAEVIGKTLEQAFKKTVCKVLAPKMKQAREKMEPDSFEARFDDDSGQKWFETRVYPFSEGITIYFSEITEQKLAQQTIKEQSEALNQAQKIAQIGSWSWDIRNGQIFWSDEMFNIYGISREEYADRMQLAVEEFIHPEDIEKIVEIRRQVESSRSFIPCEFRIIRPDGETRTLWAEAGETICDENGKAIKLSGIVHDISERKRVESERLQLEKIANRSQKIEALGALAGGIAHNFNNFLCGIFGNIELALYEENPVRKENYLKTAMSSMEPARALTRQLITFSKGGDPEMKTGEILPCVVEAAQFALTGSNIELSISSAGNLQQCNFDPGQIGQVINNLVLNSRQAMSSGGSISIKAEEIVIRKSGRENLAPGEYVKLIFSDTGPGISEKFAANIFDPFFSTKQGNPGLGLAISHSIISRHGGTISVETGTNKGCVFNIFLPVAKVKNKKRKLDDSPALKAYGRVLIMDDEKIVREVLEEILVGMGFEVKAVSDGQQVVEELINNRNRYRAVILDLTVPGRMGGKEACEIIRNSGQSLPIFAASGYSADPVIKTPEKFGFDDSIAKPFTISSLNRILAPFFQH